MEIVQGVDIDGRYRIVRPIGSGAMSTVYLAEHKLIGRRVAIKILDAQLSRDSDVVQLFMQEARAAGTLGHPNIVESTDMGFLPNRVPYIVLEYLEGGVLTDEIARVGAFSPRRTVKVALQIAQALDAAHGSGIIHRDLKSDNIFLTDREGAADHVKVLDFGISKFMASSISGNRRGQVMGTPAFMAPEQITSPEHVDTRVDIYGLGAILYHMLVGRAPFIGASPDTLLQQAVEDPPPPITRHDVPPALADLVASMLAKSPADRPQTMTDVGERLEEIRAGSGFRHNTPLPIPLGMAATSDQIPAITDVRPPQLAARPQPPPMTAPRRNKALVVALAAGSVCFAGFGLYFAFGRSSRKHEQPPPPPAASPPVVMATVPPPTPAPPPTDSRPAVELEVAIKSNAKNAHVVLRRQLLAVPASLHVVPGQNPELLEISAPGHKTMRYWITLDRAITLDARLEKGDGVVDATPEQTRIALGEASAHPAPPEQPPPPTVATKNPPPRTTTPRPKDPAVVATKADGSGNTAGSNDPKHDTGSAKPVEPPPSSPPTVDAGTSPKPDAGVTGPKPGYLDPREVRAAVLQHIGAVQECYERGRMDNPDLAGKVILLITISPTGDVTGTKVESSTLGASSVEQCVATAVRSWTFPKPAGGVAATIAYPFVLK